MTTYLNMETRVEEAVITVKVLPQTLYQRDVSAYTRDVPKVMSNFFFACELGTADEGECGGRWNQLLCYP